MNSLSSDLKYTFANNLFYVVLSNPRSGSTMLCDYLKSAGLGFPKEHLRKPVIELLQSRESGFCPIDWFYGLVQEDLSVGRVFSTKLISHFVAGAYACLTDKERELVSEILPYFKPIFLYRRDKLMQAISVLRAKQSKIWLPRNGFKVFLSRFSSCNYDYDEILNRLNGQMNADRRMFKKLNSLYDEIHVVCYEDLVEDKESEMGKILSFLGVKKPLILTLG